LAHILVVNEFAVIVHYMSNITDVAGEVIAPPNFLNLLPDMADVPFTVLTCVLL